MAERENGKNLDELLDSFLAGYSDVQPRPGFETRLRANLRANPEFQPHLSTTKVLRWLWAGAVPALIVVALAFYFALTPTLPDVPTIGAAGVPALRPIEIPVAPDRNPRVPRIRSPRAHSPGLVSEIRQQVFPTPAPLSEQERLLLRYLAGTPREEVAAQSRGDDPVEAPEQLVPQVQQFPGVETHSTR